MSEANENFEHNDNSDLPQVSELDALKARATSMGISFHSNISVEKLRERVNAKIAGADNVDEEGRVETKPGKETDAAKRSRKRLEASRLVRVRIHCNDPAKKEWPGEYITVGNNYVGTFRKYIPYNLDTPFQVPQIILNALREKVVQVFKTSNGKHGIPQRESKTIRAYTIEELPQLTQEELDELARSQIARDALNDKI